jgi:hypothetical protein
LQVNNGAVLGHQQKQFDLSFYMGCSRFSWVNRGHEAYVEATELILIQVNSARRGGNVSGWCLKLIQKQHIEKRLHQ